MRLVSLFSGLCSTYLGVLLDVYEGGKKAYSVQETFLCITFDISKFLSLKETLKKVDF